MLTFLAGLALGADLPDIDPPPPPPPKPACRWCGGEPGKKVPSVPGARGRRTHAAIVLMTSGAVTSSLGVTTIGATTVWGATGFDGISGNGIVIPFVLLAGGVSSAVSGVPVLLVGALLLLPPAPSADDDASSMDETSRSAFTARLDVTPGGIRVSGTF